MEIIKTTDGSYTFLSERFGQTYHSVHGAQTESERVFLELGLEYAAGVFNKINLFEMGWGTGLNSYLTYKRAESMGLGVDYTTIEAYPLAPEEYHKLNDDLRALHQLSWGENHQLSEYFNFKKINTQLGDFLPDHLLNLVYFDAFSPEAQPELWTPSVFKKINDYLVPQGILVTYCSKSSVQKNLKAAGFKIEKHAGPPHKREVLRAIKI